MKINSSEYFIETIKDFVRCVTEFNYAEPMYS